MKTKFTIPALLFCSIVALQSCDKAMDENFPQDFDAVLSFKTYGEQEVKLVNTGDNGIYQFTVLKGGNSPQKETSAEMVSMTEEELSSYNTEIGTNFKLLDSKYYKFDKDLTFASGERYKEVSVELMTTNMAEELDYKNEEYVLPLKLLSSVDSVNSSLDLLIIKPVIHTPVVTFTNGNAMKIIMSTQGDEIVSEDIPLMIDIDNEWTFGIEIEDDQNTLQSYVDQYNENMLSEYPILPVDNYEITTSSFNKGEILSNLNITINRTGLNIGGYVLPIKLKSCTGEVPFETQEEPLYLLVQITGELPQIELTADMLYVSSRCQWAINEKYPWNYAEECLCDGYTTENDYHWHSSWADGKVVTDPKYGIYIDVKLNDPIENLKIVYWTRQSQNNATPKTIEIYAGTSEDDLQYVETMSGLPNTKATRVESDDMLLGRKCTLIRLAIIDSSNWTDFRLDSDTNSRSVAMAELQVYGK